MIHVLRYTSSFIALFLIGHFFLLCVPSPFLFFNCSLRFIIFCRRSRWALTLAVCRCKLAALYRLVDLHGWTQGIYNHITVSANLLNHSS
jgi:hypothetical protein